MKNANYKWALALIISLFSSSTLFSQDLIERGMVLKAHYPLKSDGVDATGNYGDVTYGNHVFVDSSILSKGCRLNDTCLIETPQIDDLNDNAFAIQIDFKIKQFGGSIIQAGKGYRYLGLGTTGTGLYGYKTGSTIEEILDARQLQLNQWYTGTIIHNTANSLTEVYLGAKLVDEKKQYLEHPENDNIISNIDFSRGYAFNGYLRNLKVYTADKLLASVGDLSATTELSIFPNPTASLISINAPVNPGVNVTISDIHGRVLVKTIHNNHPIDVSQLSTGVYLVKLYENGYLTKRGRFVKE